MRDSCDVASTCSVSAARCRNTAGSTCCNADFICASRAALAQRPNSSQRSSGIGSVLTGMRWPMAANGDSKGNGARAKVVLSTRPIRFAGGLAAIETAIGPENDSPSSTKGTSVGRTARTSASSAG